MPTAYLFYVAENLQELNMKEEFYLKYVSSEFFRNSVLVKLPELYLSGIDHKRPDVQPKLLNFVLNQPELKLSFNEVLIDFGDLKNFNQAILMTVSKYLRRSKTLNLINYGMDDAWDLEVFVQHMPFTQTINFVDGLFYRSSEIEFKAEEVEATPESCAKFWSHSGKRISDHLQHLRVVLLEIGNPTCLPPPTIVDKFLLSLTPKSFKFGLKLGGGTFFHELPLTPYKY